MDQIVLCASVVTEDGCTCHTQLLVTGTNHHFHFEPYNEGSTFSEPGLCFYTRLSAETIMGFKIIDRESY